MPRSKPVSQREIKAREEFGLGPVAASPSRLNSKQWPSWDFSEPMNVLRIKGDKKRSRCKEALTLVCKSFFLEEFAEKQETPDRKACSLQRTQQWRKQWQRYLAELKHAVRTKNKKAANTLVRRMWGVQIPQMLEQEVYRLRGDPIEQNVAMLQEKYKKASRRGRVKSLALARLIHRLQALASEHRRDLIWLGRNIPPDLIRFVRATLEAAGIRHAGHDNPSKLRKHMIKYDPKSKPPPEPDLEIESPLEQRLSKMYL
jgi:hypothetical protein